MATSTPAGSGVGRVILLGGASSSGSTPSELKNQIKNTAKQWDTVHQTPLLTPTKQLAAPKGPAAPKGFLQKAESTVKNVVTHPVGDVKAVGKSIAQPFEDVGQHLVNQAKYLAGPTASQAQRNILTNNQARAAKNPEYTKAVQSTDTKNNSVAGIAHAQELAHNGAKAPEIKSALQADQKAVGNQEKQALADTAQIASTFVGGAEVKGAVAAGKAAKVGAAVKDIAGAAGAGGVSGGASVVSTNPNAGIKQVAEGAGVGAAVGAGFGAAGKVVGTGLRMVFGKAADEAPVAPPPKAATSIPVKDASTGTVKGTVSNVLPKSSGVTVQPITEASHLLEANSSARPSSLGYSDADFRAAINPGAKEVVKNTPATSEAFLKTGSHDPTTLAMQTLADNKSKPVTGAILDQLVPGLAPEDRKAAVSALLNTKNPHEASDIVWDAHQAANTTAKQGEANLTGTPMDKQVSFNGKGDTENAQRQQLHVQLGKAEHQIAEHENGTKLLTPEDLANVTNIRDKSASVLNGEKSLQEAFPNKVPTVGKQPAVNDLPFGDEKSRVAEAQYEAGAKQHDGSVKGLLKALPVVKEGDKTRQAVVNRKAAVAETLDQFHVKDVQAAAKKLDDHDMKLVEKLESDTQMSKQGADARMVRIANSAAHKPNAFINYARLLRADYDKMLSMRQELHPDLQGRSNYFAHSYDRTDVKTDAEISKREQEAQRARPGMSNKPSYTHSRTIPTYAEAESLGLKRANPNVQKDYEEAVKAQAQENGRAALVQGLGQAHGEGSISNKVGFDPVSGKNFASLEIPGGHGISMPQNLADHYNSRAPSKLSTTAPEDRTKLQTGRAGYKVVNKTGKNVVLAGGLFHGLRTAVTTSGQQLFNLRNVTHPISQLHDNLRLIAETADPTGKIHANRLAQLSKDGESNVDGRSTLQRARLANLTFSGKEIQGDLAPSGNKGKIEKYTNINKVPILKQSHAAVFDRQIPAAKLMIFKQATNKLDFSKSQDLAKAREIADGINSGLGGVDNAVNGLTPKAASAADNFILGRDLNEGILRTLGKAGKFNRSDGKIARQFVVGSAVVSALPGLAVLAATGKLNTKDPNAIAHAFVDQIEDPQIPTPWRNAPSQSQKNGTPISLKMPTTFVSLVSKILKPALDPMSTFDGTRTSGLQDTASARLAFVPATAEKLATNKDFYGQPIYGNGISGKQTATNVAEQVAPIPASQISRATSGAENKDEAALNELGLRGSTSTLPGPEQQHAEAINDFYNTKASISAAHSKVTKQMNTLIAAGKTNQAARIAQQFNQSLNQRTLPFRTKYASNYNPAWDDKNQGFQSFIIPTSKEAFKSRFSSAKEKQKVLQ